MVLQLGIRNNYHDFTETMKCVQSRTLRGYASRNLYPLRSVHIQAAVKTVAARIIAKKLSITG